MTYCGPPGADSARRFVYTEHGLMITVHVQLFATLRQHRPGLGLGERFPVELPDGASVRDLTRKLELPEEQVKLIFVNGLFQDFEHGLADGDEVGIFPPVGGG